MTTVKIEEFWTDPDRYLAQTAQGDVVVVKQGRPWIVLRGVHDDQDRLSAAYANSPEFRKMIQERRQEESIPWGEVRQDLGLD